MSEIWSAFEESARRWAREGERDSTLSSTPESFVAQAYQAWLSVREGDNRRTQGSFEARFEQLHEGKRVASLYRKLRGAIRPRRDELQLLLSTLFVSTSDEDVATPADAARVQDFIDSLVDLLVNRRPDLVADGRSGWILSGGGNPVLGPDDYTRDAKLRTLLGGWLDTVSTEVIGLPFITWIIDVSKFAVDGEPAYETRRTISGLTSSLLSLLSSEWSPPGARATLEFVAAPSFSLPDDVRISLGDEQERVPLDLRTLLTSCATVCVVGLPRPKVDGGKPSLKLEGDFQGDFYERALAPEAIVSRITASDKFGDLDRIDRMLASTSRRDVCLGTKIEIEALEKICECLTEPVKDFEKIERTIGLQTSHLIFHYEVQAAGNTEVKEDALPSIKTPRAVQLALFTVLVAAAARLSEQDGQGVRLAAGTIGREVTDLLRAQGVRLLTIGEFLNLERWLLPEEGNRASMALKGS